MYIPTYSFLNAVFAFNDQVAFTEIGKKALAALEQGDSNYCPSQMEQNLMAGFSALLELVHEQKVNKVKNQIVPQNGFIESIDGSRWITKTEAAELCGVDRHTIMNHRKMFLENRSGVNVKSFLEWLKNYKNGSHFKVFEYSWKQKYK